MRRLHSSRVGPVGWTPQQDAPRNPPVVVAPTEPSPHWRDLLASAGSGRLLTWLAVVGALVVAVGVLGIGRHHAAASGPPPASVPPTMRSAPPAQLVVDVGGRVRHPGLVTLAAGARVADAIAAAGGALRPSDLATVNLAARVTDGELLLVGVPGAAVGGGAPGGGGPVDLNSATVDQLDALPGVGPVLAQRIVSWRDAHGGFGSVDDLQQVPGIGARKFADLKSLVTV